MPHLLERRLLFVTGKGGVGKSTVAVALGMLAARRGLRTIVAELTAESRLQRAFERNGNHAETDTREVEVAPGLFTISIEPQRAMEEYLRLKAGPLGHAMSASRLFNAFAMATPGMRELLSVGKVWELAQFERRTRDAAPYDLVVVDAPATGHGVGILRTPRTFAEIARVGPIAHQGGQIARTIADREFTGVIAVSTPEEMAVNETINLDAALRAEGLTLEAAIVNARYPERFSDRDARTIRRALAGEPSADRNVRVALRAALSERERSRGQALQQERLAASLACPVITLPFVFAPALGPAELATLSAALEDVLP